MSCVSRMLWFGAVMTLVSCVAQGRAEQTIVTQYEGISVSSAIRGRASMSIRISIG